MKSVVTPAPKPKRTYPCLMQATSNTRLIIMALSEGESPEFIRGIVLSDAVSGTGHLSDTFSARLFTHFAGTLTLSNF